jgi:hypothetical protein
VRYSTREEWAAEKLARELATLASATTGGRNEALNRAAFVVRHYVADGSLRFEDVEARLQEAGTALGLGARETRETIRSGLRGGVAAEAWYPESLRNGAAFTTLPSGQRRTPKAHRRAASPDLPTTTAPPSVRITVFEHMRATKGTPRAWTWEELAAEVAAPTEGTYDRDRLELISAAEIEDDDRRKRQLPEGGERGAEVYAVHALLLDYDDEPTWSPEAVEGWWGGLQYVCYSSGHHMVPKHGKGDPKPAGPRGRVILALKRPVDAEEFERLGEWVIGCGRGKVGEKELRNPRLGYFVPFRTAHYVSSSNLNGRALDVDELFARLDREERDAAEPHDGERRHETTPDGRPYLVKMPGGTIWYIATADGFAPCDKDLLRPELTRHWPGLVTTVQGEDGPPRPMGAAALYERYGVRADQLFYSYTDATRFHYRPPHTGDLHVRCILGAPPAPVRHEVVLAWLRTLCSTEERYDRVLDWLATLPRLDRPTCALLLLGPPSLGKGMLAAGVARYFGTAITAYDEVFQGRFNDSLLRSPVVWLDEISEVDARSGRFRSLLGNSVHSVEGKYRPAGTLLGCPRLLVSSNNPDPLKLGREDLTRDDEDAIGSRILIVDCAPATAGWLAERGGRTYTAGWVEVDGRPGKLPETIAWLAEHREVDTTGRFLVMGDAGEWAARAATRTGLPATILEAIGRYASVDDNGRHIERDLHERVALACPDGPQPFTFDDNHPEVVLVSNEGLRAAWGVLFREHAPSHRQVSNALQRLAPDGNQKVATKNHGRIRAYSVPLRLVPHD